MARKVQFKVMLTPEAREIVRLHAAKSGKDLSTTVEEVVVEVLGGELSEEDLLDARRKSYEAEG